MRALLSFRIFTQCVIVMMIFGLFSPVLWGDEVLIWQFQNSSTIIEKTDVTRTQYSCESGVSECNVNLLFSDIRPSPKTHYSCTIDFGFASEIRTDDCNPNQVTVPVGSWPVTVIVKNIDTDIEISRSTPFTIIHAEGNNDDPEEVNHDPMDFTGLQIVVDSGLDESLACRTSTCQTNFHIDAPVGALCTWNFGAGTTAEGNTTKCNPGFVYFTSDTSISAIVSDPHFPENIFTQTLQIRAFSSGGELDDEDAEGGDGEGTEPIDLSTVQIVVDSGLDGDNTCTGEACQVNFSLAPVPPVGTLCSWDFGPDAVTSEENPGLCNPGYVKFPTDTTVVLTFMDPHFPENIQTRTLQVKRKDFSTGGSSNSASGAGGNVLAPLELKDSKIIVQSGLDSDGRCRTDICQVNFIAEVPAVALCKWDFSGGIFETVDTDKKCNPGYVRFFADTSVTLTVTDPNNTSNVIQKTFQVFRFAPLVTLESPTDTLVARIALQTKLTKNKQLTSEGIVCKITKKSDSCSLNFSGQGSTGADKYLWQYGDGSGDDKENPGSHNFAPGKYTVTLTIVRGEETSQDEYIVEVIRPKEEELEEEKCMDCVYYKGKLRISAVLPNPPHTDTTEWIEIENISDDSMSLDHCSLVSGGSDFELSGDLDPHEKLRLRQVQTGITLANSKETLEIMCGSIEIDTFSWDFSVPTSYVLRRDILDQIPQQVQVEKTIDGDTIDVILFDKKTRVRLLGVDTPETVHPLKPVQAFGKEASEFTKNTLTGQTVWLTFDWNPTDHYGRTLAYVWNCPGLFDEEKCTLFNARLVRGGYGRMERRFPFIRYEAFDDLEKLAKSEKLGIWSDSDVSREMNSLSSEEKETLLSEQELEYLEDQEELLLLCEGSSEDEECEKPTWEELTKNITKLNTSLNKSGKVAIGLKTWSDQGARIQIRSGENILEARDVTTDELGEYTFDWFPRNIGEYEVSITLANDENATFSLADRVIVENISDHFLTSLSGDIVVQGTFSDNRWVEGSTFHCRSRGSCSVNVTAESNRSSDVTYLWTLPDGSTLEKKNPTAIELTYGNYVLGLVITDNLTGEKVEKILTIEHAPIPKKSRATSRAQNNYTLDLKDVEGENDMGGGVIRDDSQAPLKTLAMSILTVLTLSGSVIFFKK